MSTGDHRKTFDEGAKTDLRMGEKARVDSIKKSRQRKKTRPPKSNDKVRTAVDEKPLLTIEFPPNNLSTNTEIKAVGPADSNSFINGLDGLTSSDMLNACDLIDTQFSESDASNIEEEAVCSKIDTDETEPDLEAVLPIEDDLEAVLRIEDYPSLEDDLEAVLRIEDYPSLEDDLDIPSLTLSDCKSIRLDYSTGSIDNLPAVAFPPIQTESINYAQSARTELLEKLDRKNAAKIIINCQILLPGPIKADWIVVAGYNDSQNSEAEFLTIKGKCDLGSTAKYFVPMDAHYSIFPIKEFWIDEKTKQCYGIIEHSYVQENFAQEEKDLHISDLPMIQSEVLKYISKNLETTIQSQKENLMSDSKDSQDKTTTKQNESADGILVKEQEDQTAKQTPRKPIPVSKEAQRVLDEATTFSTRDPDYEARQERMQKRDEEKKKLYNEALKKQSQLDDKDTSPKSLDDKVISTESIIPPLLDLEVALQEPPPIPESHKKDTGAGTDGGYEELSSEDLAEFTEDDPQEPYKEPTPTPQASENSIETALPVSEINESPISFSKTKPDYHLNQEDVRRSESPITVSTSSNNTSEETMPDILVPFNKETPDNDSTKHADADKETKHHSPKTPHTQSQSEKKGQTKKGRTKTEKNQPIQDDRIPNFLSRFFLTKKGHETITSAIRDVLAPMQESQYTSEDEKIKLQDEKIGQDTSSTLHNLVIHNDYYLIKMGVSTLLKENSLFEKALSFAMNTDHGQNALVSSIFSQNYDVSGESGNLYSAFEMLVIRNPELFASVIMNTHLTFSTDSPDTPSINIYDRLQQSQIAFISSPQGHEQIRNALTPWKQEVHDDLKAEFLQDLDISKIRDEVRDEVKRTLLADIQIQDLQNTETSKDVIDILNDPFYGFTSKESAETKPDNTSDPLPTAEFLPNPTITASLFANSPLQNLPSENNKNTDPEIQILDLKKIKGNKPLQAKAWLGVITVAILAAIVLLFTFQYQKKQVQQKPDSKIAQTEQQENTNPDAGSFTMHSTSSEPNSSSDAGIQQSRPEIIATIASTPDTASSKNQSTLQEIQLGYIEGTVIFKPSKRIITSLIKLQELAKQEHLKVSNFPKIDNNKSINNETMEVNLFSAQAEDKGKTFAKADISLKNPKTWSKKAIISFLSHKKILQQIKAAMISNKSASSFPMFLIKQKGKLRSLWAVVVGNKKLKFITRSVKASNKKGSPVVYAIIKQKRINKSKK